MEFSDDTNSPARRTRNCSFQKRLLQLLLTLFSAAWQTQQRPDSTEGDKRPVNNAPREQRKQEADAILQKYPQRIPVIVERAPNSHVPSIDKQKFLVPNDITVAQFMWIVRKRIHLSPEKALFVFVGRLMPQSSLSMGDLYTTYHDDDGFLYLAYSGENTFGGGLHSGTSVPLQT